MGWANCQNPRNCSGLWYTSVGEEDEREHFLHQFGEGRRELFCYLCGETIEGLADLWKNSF